MNTSHRTSYSHSTLKQVMNDRDTVVRRSMSLKVAVEEYDKSVQKLITEAEVKAKSVKLQKKEMAALIGVTRAHLYKMPGIEIDELRTYEDLWFQISRNRPKLLPTLEMNFHKYLQKLRSKKR